MLGRGAQRKGDMPYMLFCSYLGVPCFQGGLTYLYGAPRPPCFSCTGLHDPPDLAWETPEALQPRAELLCESRVR